MLLIVPSSRTKHQRRANQKLTVIALLVVIGVPMEIGRDLKMQGANPLIPTVVRVDLVKKMEGEDPSDVVVTEEEKGARQIDLQDQMIGNARILLREKVGRGNPIKRGEQRHLRRERVSGKW